MKKPKKSTYETDSHGAFGEYETHMNWSSYANALEDYIKFLEDEIIITC